MKYFVISDLHGSVDCVKKVLDIYQNDNFDGLIILGDQLYHGPRNPLPDSYNPAEVLELLNKFSGKIIAVRGNCDSEVDQMVLEYPIMDDYKVIDLKNRKLFISHGHIYSPEELPKEMKKTDVFLFGHIHLPIAKEENGVYIGNPGSITLPKGGNPNSYGIITDVGFTVYDFSENILKQIVF